MVALRLFMVDGLNAIVALARRYGALLLEKKGEIPHLLLENWTENAILHLRHAFYSLNW